MSPVEQASSPNSAVNAEEIIHSEIVKRQLARLLDTPYFRMSPRLKRFLAFTIDQSLAGNQKRLKEYCIALEVFAKPESFDPRIDSAVRVAARQLRAKLDAYYLNEGSQDEILIRFRPGDYVPRFYPRNSLSASSSNGSGDQRISRVRTVVVEKERSAAKVIVDALDSHDHPVAAVLDNAEEMLQRFPSLPGECVVTGYQLAGGMTGLDLVRELRKRQGPPALFLSPTAWFGNLAEDLLQAQPAATIFRPIRPLDLDAGLKLAVAQHRLQKQNLH